MQPNQPYSNSFIVSEKNKLKIRRSICPHIMLGAQFARLDVLVKLAKYHSRFYPNLQPSNRRFTAADSSTNSSSW